MADDDEIIPLNLATTYPVRWSVFKVLRDFVQNFFDAVGPAQFARRVAVTTDLHGVEIRADDVAFGHEWLIPIGASTKTAAPEGRYAGHFGEGFKIAALCAIRDHGWTVAAGSRAWELEVTSAPRRIDGRRIDMLAYRLKRRSRAVGESWVRLGRTSPDDVQLLREAVVPSFCYPENPLLGDELWSDERTSVWRRSSRPIPRGYPRSGGSARGILFHAWQAAGTHELPFALAAHDVRQEDRDRAALYDFQVVDALARLSGRLPPNVAGEVLESVRRHWASYPKRAIEVGSWHPVVRGLTRRLAEDRVEVQRWRARNPLLAVTERISRGDHGAGNRRRQALDWLRGVGGSLTLVQDGFLRLGYPRLEELCERAGGFTKTRTARRGLERARLALVQDFVAEHLASFFPAETRPPLLVIDDPRSAWSGVAVTHPLRPSLPTPSGHRVRARLESIAVCASALSDVLPSRALATILHELAHMFGGDGSKRFAGVLTDLLGRVAELHAELAELERAWRRCGES